MMSNLKSHLQKCSLFKLFLLWCLLKQFVVYYANVYTVVFIKHHSHRERKRRHKKHRRRRHSSVDDDSDESVRAATFSERDSSEEAREEVGPTKSRLVGFLKFFF